MHRAYERQLEKLPTAREAALADATGIDSEAQLVTAGAVYGQAPKPTEVRAGLQVRRAALLALTRCAGQAALNRMVEEMKEREERSKKFSRRRRHMQGEDVDFINERNRFFNKKLDRAFGKYTVEIKQNLERGTAL